MQYNAENSLTRFKEITKVICKEKFIFAAIHDPYLNFMAGNSISKLAKRYHLFYGNVAKKHCKCLILVKIMDVEDRILKGSYTDSNSNEVTFISKKFKVPVTIFTFTGDTSCDNERGMINLKFAFTSRPNSSVIAAIGLKKSQIEAKESFILTMKTLMDDEGLTLIRSETEKSLREERLMIDNNDFFVCVNDSFKVELDKERMKCMKRTDPYLLTMTIDCSFN